MEGIAVGVFGTDPQTKSAFETSVAKRSEAEGIVVNTRTEGGRRNSFLDVTDYPERVQGYARVASIADHALYFFPNSGKLTPPDGELAVLLGAFGLPGTLELTGGATSPEAAMAALKGTSVAEFHPEKRPLQSSAIDLSRAVPRVDFPRGRALVYIDRVFIVKGVGTVALGFVLAGAVSVHDQLRPVPGPPGLRVDVKGIQVNDVDVETAGRGVRVGLSLRGVGPQDLERSHWFDDGSFPLSDRLTFEMAKSRFYKQGVDSRDLHLQLAGEMMPARIASPGQTEAVAQLPWQVPTWDGMRGALIDLNAGNLRVVGGLTGKF